MPAVLKRFPYRIPVALLGLSLLLGLIAFVQAEPMRDVRQPLFRVGDTWEYRHYQVATGKVYRTSVVVVTQVHGDSVRIRETNSASESPTETDSKISEMYTWSWPLFVGKKWTAPIIKDGSMIGQIQYVVRGWENVSTTAGTFETLRLENAFTRPEGSFRQVLWYAPAVGRFVRLYYLDKDDKPFQATELTRFKHQ